MTIEGIIGALIIGLIIGALGRLVVPGKQDIPIWLTIVVGIVAALIGSLIVGSLRDTDGIDWIELVVQIALAAAASQACAVVVRPTTLTLAGHPRSGSAGGVRASHGRPTNWRRRGDLNSRWG